jgi:HAD superfamily hydrolase (TIGR01459 family)
VAVRCSLINGLSEIAEGYDHFILDVYGVLHDGIRPFPHTIDALTQMKRAGKRICLLSNSPRRSEPMEESLAAMRITRDLYDHVWTSGEATYHALKNRPAEWGDHCWFIGTHYGAEITRGHGLTLVQDPREASFILNSIPGTEGSARSQLTRGLEIAARRGLPMICANPDLVVNIGDEQFECAGTFALEYDRIGGRVLYEGKPHRPVYEKCHALLGHPEKRRLCAVGDSFHTDIAGANGFGIDSVMNLVGIHWDEVETNGQPDPGKLEHLLDTAKTHPDYLMAGLRW